MTLGEVKILSQNTTDDAKKKVEEQSLGTKNTKEDTAPTITQSHFSKVMIEVVNKVNDSDDKDSDATKREKQIKDRIKNV